MRGALWRSAYSPNVTFMKKKVIIVGAGPGGLSTGMILAHRGYDVQVFERHKEVGGRNAPIRAEGSRSMSVRRS